MAAYCRIDESAKLAANLPSREAGRVDVHVGQAGEDIILVGRSEVPHAELSVAEGEVVERAAVGSGRREAMDVRPGLGPRQPRERDPVAHGVRVRVDEKLPSAEGRRCVWRNLLPPQEHGAEDVLRAD